MSYHSFNHSFARANRKSNYVVKSYAWTADNQQSLTKCACNWNLRSTTTKRSIICRHHCVTSSNECGFHVNLSNESNCVLFHRWNNFETCLVRHTADTRTHTESECGVLKWQSQTHSQKIRWQRIAASLKSHNELQPPTYTQSNHLSQKLCPYFSRLSPSALVASHHSHV